MLLVLFLSTLASLLTVTTFKKCSLKRDIAILLFYSQLAQVWYLEDPHLVLILESKADVLAEQTKFSLLCLLQYLIRLKHDVDDEYEELHLIGLHLLDFSVEPVI